MSCSMCGGKGWYKAGGTWEDCNFCDKNKVKKEKEEVVDEDTTYAWWHRFLYNDN